MGEIFIKVKIIFTVLFVLVFLGLSCVSAEENQTDLAVDDFGQDPEILTVDNEDSGSFTELKTKIAESGNELKLEKDYKYIGEADSEVINGIEVEKSDYVLDGQGHTIDGSEVATLFRFSGDNITVKNLRIINTYAEDSQSYSALYFQNDGVIDNCTFENNRVQANGGAIYAYELDLIDSSFENNNAKKGGAVYFSKGTITGSNFTSNSADEGGAIYIFG